MAGGRGEVGDDGTRTGDSGAAMTEVLTFNAGSSSLKFGLFGAGADTPCRAIGRIEPIGGAAELTLQDGDGAVIDRADLDPSEAADHDGATRAVLRLLQAHFPAARIGAVGHRVVHGGPDHGRPAAITPAVLAELQRLAPFAPLHQPHNLAGIAAAQAAFPQAIQVACFDTGFHRGHPFVNDTFALPREFYARGLRRYGFHGLSYDYIQGELRRIAPQLRAGRVVVAHLGNGASMCAMSGGRSVTSTMGFTALDGLPMGTRSGQIDPGVLLYLMQQEGMDAAAISDLLYHRSGLLGLSGLSNDMRRLEAAGTPEAAEAIDYFVARIRESLGALTAALGGLDALVFTGGIGEHSPAIRQRVCQGMGWLGIALDPARNAENATVISTPDGAVRVLAMPTNEEVVIARAAAALLARR